VKYKPKVVWEATSLFSPCPASILDNCGNFLPVKCKKVYWAGKVLLLYRNPVGDDVVHSDTHLPVIHCHNHCHGVSFKLFIQLIFLFTYRCRRLSGVSKLYKLKI
jgi:hypothetical protein